MSNLPLKPSQVVANRGGIVVTSRLDSSRFPNKALKPLLGMPVLSWSLTRLSTLNLPLVLATSDRQIDQPLLTLCQKLNVPVFRGHAHDLLKRLFNTIVFYEWDWLVRISGDSPAIDPNLVLKAIDILKKQNLSNSKNTYIISNLYPTRSYPSGQSVELISLSSLTKLISLTNNLNPTEREHVTSYAYKNPDLFSILSFYPKTPSPKNINFTIDYPQDLEKISEIASSMESPITANLQEWIDAHLLYNLKSEQK